MTISIEISDLRDLIVRRLAQRYPLDDAETMADSVLFGELIGRPSHGIARLLPGSYGPMDEQPSGTPVIEWKNASTARITGGPGILVASLATRLVGELALENGMAVVGTTGSHSTSGSLLHYVEQLTSRRLVGFVMTNSVSLVAPPKGMERLLGTNPLAVGIPAVGHPFVLDMATAAITGGEVVSSARIGVALPDGVAVDRQGEATNDPQAVLDGGALMAFGGHKGLGLSMMVQLLSGVFGASSALPISVDDNWSHFFMAISLESFGDPDELQLTAQELIDRIGSTTTRDGSKVRIPGHRSLAMRDAALAKGTVEIDPHTLHQLRGFL